LDDVADAVDVDEHAAQGERHILQVSPSLYFFFDLAERAWPVPVS
jgi:hypothetical protein